MQPSTTSQPQTATYSPPTTDGPFLQAEAHYYYGVTVLSPIDNGLLELRDGVLTFYRQPDNTIIFRAPVRSATKIQLFLTDITLFINGRRLVFRLAAGDANVVLTGLTAGSGLGLLSMRNAQKTVRLEDWVNALRFYGAPVKFISDKTWGKWFFITLAITMGLLFFGILIVVTQFYVRGR